MLRILRAFLAVAFVGGSLCTVTGEENFRDINPTHPMFSALEIGQFISVRWEQTGCVISDWGGIKKIEAIGRDFLVYTETGVTYYLYINQVKLVVVRPGGRIIDPVKSGALQAPEDLPDQPESSDQTPGATREGDSSDGNGGNAEGQDAPEKTKKPKQQPTDNEADPFG